VINMRVVIMGSGAVGGFYGALLAHQGHDVTFVARGARLAAMRERGLEIQRPDGTVRLRPVQAVATPAEAGAGIDLILFTVKGYDTEAAIEALRPAVGPSTTVLTLQNGVDSPDQLAAAFGAERVLAGTTTVNAAVPEPGVVVDRGAALRTTLAELSGEVTPRLEAVAAALRGVGGEVIVSDDAQRALWLKFMILAPHATITSACGEPIGAIRALPEGAALYRQLIGETAAVGRAAGVALPADVVETTVDFIMNLPPAARSSLAIDFDRRGRVELEQLTGAIVRRSHALGVPTPGFSALYAVLKVRAAAMSSDE
jgi:2-dehydropantoate 2-reductase